jgi:hypothetical protein
MYDINDLHGATFAHPAELLSAIAFEKLSQITVKMKTMLDANRKILHSFLLGRDDLDYFLPEYGTVVFPRLKNGAVDSFCNLLRDDFETRVVPGSFFEDPQRFRVGVGGETESVRAALQQLGQGLDAYHSALQMKA